MTIKVEIFKWTATRATRKPIIKEAGPQGNAIISVYIAIATTLSHISTIDRVTGGWYSVEKNTSWNLGHFRVYMWKEEPPSALFLEKMYWLFRLILDLLGYQANCEVNLRLFLQFDFYFINFIYLFYLLLDFWWEFIYLHIYIYTAADFLPVLRAHWIDDSRFWHSRIWQ